ncbi:hypothetical protein CA984_21350 [Streptosporangium minutum]|uniref:Uncharacterized protein n=1 Tax=Streptosporangium minutum TaxID=569862 RepID=A0A243RIN3_9ACTN|nr:hypothetical protein CA984_21350 [Streptosporangium minutum]
MQDACGVAGVPRTVCGACGTAGGACGAGGGGCGVGGACDGAGARGITEPEGSGRAGPPCHVAGAGGRFRRRRWSPAAAATTDPDASARSSGSGSGSGSGRPPPAVAAWSLLVCGGRTPSPAEPPARTGADGVVAAVPSPEPATGPQPVTVRQARSSRGRSPRRSVIDRLPRRRARVTRVRVPPW